MFGYPGDGINGLIAAFGKADNQPRFIQARHEEMAALAAAGYAKFSDRSASAWRPPGRVPSTCSTASTTPSSTTCRSSRSSGRPHAARWAAATSRRSTCRRCSRTSRSDYLVEVNVAEQLPNALDRAFRTAQARRAPTARDHSRRPAGGGLRGAGARVQAGAVQPARHVARPRLSPDRVDSPGRAATILNAGDEGRDPRRPGRPRRGREVRCRSPSVTGAGRGEGAARQGRAARRPAVCHRVDRPAGHPAQLRADARLRHATDRRLQLPVQPVPARVRQGPRGADRHRRRRSSGCAIPPRSTSSPTRRPRCAALLPLLDPQGRPVVAGDRSSRTSRDWWPLSSGRRMLSADPVNPDADRVGAVAAPARRRDRHRRTPARRPTGTPAACGCGPAMRGSLSGTLATMGPAVPYAIGAKFAHPDRPAIALVGDGAMQMNGLAELLTIAPLPATNGPIRGWWSACSTTTTSTRSRGSCARWAARRSSRSPNRCRTCPTPTFARIAGAARITVDDPDAARPGWDEALAADEPDRARRPHCDPEVPPIPPHATFEQMKSTAEAIAQGRPERLACGG